MFPFILLMVGQFNDSVSSLENTALDGRMDKKITDLKRSGMKYSCPSLNGRTEENYGNFRYNSSLRYYFRLAFHKVDCNYLTETNLRY